MAASVQSWRGAIALLTIGAIVVLLLFVLLRPLRVDSPASAGARELLRIDNALGATVEPVDRATASRFGLTGDRSGLIVTSVASKGPASSAGIRVGDVIETVGGKRAAAGRDWLQADSSRSSEAIALVRGGKTATVDVQLARGDRR